MSYQPMNDVYLDFDILLSLRPESTEGIIQYSNMITHWIFYCTRFVTSILIGRCDKFVTIEYFYTISKIKVQDSYPYICLIVANSDFVLKIILIFKMYTHDNNFLKIGKRVTEIFFKRI